MTSYIDVNIVTISHREIDDDMFVSCLLLDKFILSLICFVRMDLIEQSHIDGEAWDVRCDEKCILNKTYQ